MKINSVELENYRIHKSARFEFGNGINLILGRNGAGKSSILEAIGMALFGAYTRTSDKEAVRNGEKNSYICIEITGNDGIEYVVEKKIGNTSLHRIYPKDNKSEAVTGVELVLSKIAEISGIEKNSKKIYQNVITAYQNKIVNIFTETPKNRETLFNEIFDTAIYRELYQGYLKSAVDKYIIEKKVVEKETGELSATIEDSETIEKEIEEKKKIEEGKNSEYIKLKESVEEVEREIKTLETVKRNFERLEQEVEDRNKMIEENNKGIKNSEEGIKRAEESVVIIKNSEMDYKEYIQVESIIGEQEKEIEFKENIKKEIEKAEKRVHEENRKKVEISTLKNEKTEQLKEIEEQKEKSDIKLKEREEIEKEFKEKLEKIKIKEQESKILLEKGEQYIELYEKTEKELNEFLNKKNVMEESNVNIEDITKNITEIDKTIDDLKVKIDIKKEIENSIREYEVKNKELKRAEEKLSGGSCPYLKEQCLNISKNSSFAEYFAKRAEEIELKIKEKTDELLKFAGVEKKVEEISGERAVLLQKRDDFEKTIREINELKTKIEIVLGKKENILLKAANDLNFGEKELSYEELKYKVKNIGNNFISEKKEIEEKEQRVLEIEKEIELLRKDNFELKEKLKNSKIEIEKLLEEEKNSLKIIVIAEKFIKEKTEKIVNLEELKKSLLNLKEKRDSLKRGYDLYNSNIKIAMGLDELKKNRDELIKSRYEKEQEVEIKNIEKKEIIEKYNFEKIEEFVLEKNRKMELKEQASEILTQIRVEIGKLEEKFAENKRKNEKLKEKRKKLKNIEKKIEISQKFRDNVNTMGKAVAAGLLSSIEKMATENFRRMTGRDEEINWINSEKESYSVYLTGNDRGSTRFEVLSGGEQVAAALSIRAAMASTLTTADFAIFDEPTINLDKIRKEALAESLKEILKDLEQAIIVTHDDLFEEMAERIIIVE